MTVLALVKKYRGRACGASSAPPAPNGSSAFDVCLIYELLGAASLDVFTIVLRSDILSLRRNIGFALTFLTALLFLVDL